MHHVIRLFEPLLRLLLPGSGRHRPVEAPPVRPVAPPRWVRVRHTEVLRGEDSALVRPYLIAHERRQYARRLPEVVW
ncbi:hypothetical protein HEK616_62120 [Streptomyces nigrescens]|uniref:Uncharacterized protein n=1 Tax=Streptomyces nigrescens TaxID=1920 RepID=A0ABM8A250_STRNI|nr:hypothetical protein [Streptomyces nigrescens]BDM72725.1 hypothetical protein HEK616_62120 [Streptomyces nigrescens]